ncbi:MAG: B12-binding domain-containing radical SAM protein [Planctomycetota bacterium]
MKSKKKVVMYLPHRGDPVKGELISADLLPLELIQIAGPALQRGWTVQLIDAMVEERPLEAVLAACADASVFCSSCILGYQILDGVTVSNAVREKYPHLAIWWGGWFPSAVPELFLNGASADAVCIGQGEITFGNMLDAFEAHTPLDGIKGLALLRDDHVLFTERQPVVGFEEYPRAPFEVIDLQRYYAEQRRQCAIESSPNGRGIRHRFPDPPGKSAYPAISYHSSFGCPEPCTFCNSPGLTERRYKMYPAEQLLDHIQEIMAKDPFHGLRFQDANFGVSEKRTRAFSEGLLKRGIKLTWHATIEIKQMTQYSDSTLDLMRDSGLYIVPTGVEAASWEMQQAIGKRIKPGETLRAIERLDSRGIVAGCSYIIGYPGETEESMRATLDEARAIKNTFEHASVDVFPYRPIPGASLWQDALDKGYEAPTTAAQWGQMFEYKVDSWKGAIPPRVLRDWSVFNFLAPWVDGHVRATGLTKKVLMQAARWRMRHGVFGMPVEFKAYHRARRLMDRLWTSHVSTR